MCSSDLARGNMTHILVMVDKFTKWIEVKPIRKCDGHTAVSFLKDIILRYGHPHSIITDNGTNFAEGAFARFCQEKRIRLDLASVAHPQSNGRVERSNALVLPSIKPPLIEPLLRAPGCWPTTTPPGTNPYPSPRLRPTVGCDQDGHPPL